MSGEHTPDMMQALRIAIANETAAERDRLRAEVERLTVERDQFMDAACVRDQRDADMQEIMRINNSLLAEKAELIAALSNLIGICDDKHPVLIENANAVLAKAIATDMEAQGQS